MANPEVKKILIVDDEDAIRENLAIFLEDEGFDVVEQATAELAIECMRGEKFFCVIVDLRLPGADGTEFIKRASIINPELQFLIHTGSTEFTLSPELRKIGITPNNVLHKPVNDMAVIANMIRTMRVS